MNQLDQLRKMTTVVADSGDIEAIKAYQPTDATTNPSLVLSAAQKEEYQEIIARSIAEAPHTGSKESRDHQLINHLFVNFGVELLKTIPGRVSTEVSPTLSFDTQHTVETARSLINLYEKKGIPRERVLIKIASTWEGIRAAEVLEMEGIHCNMTLLFSLVQAANCAEAKVTLISPFVGRVSDWQQQHHPLSPYTPKEDQGVQLVSAIYNYYKKFDYKTLVMGASFRKKEQIIALAGCDLLTISPKFLEQLSQETSLLHRALSPEQAQTKIFEKILLSESQFRYQFNQDPMAVEKLSDGIRTFAKDSHKLLDLLKQFH